MSALLQTWPHVFIVCVATSLLASCSGGSEPILATSFDDLAPTPLATAEGDSGNLKVAVYSTPTQPPAAGEVGMVMVVTAATTGAPVEGLSLAVTPWMPAMGHGSCCVPTFKDMGKGRYESKDVSLVMQGEWQLRTQFSGKVDDSAAPTFDVP